MTLDEFSSLVGDISQRGFFSGWQDEIEVELWLVANGLRDRVIGQTQVTESEVQRMRDHLASGTWIKWDGKPELVPLSDWAGDLEQLRKGPRRQWLFSTGK